MLTINIRNTRIILSMIVTHIWFLFKLSIPRNFCQNNYDDKIKGAL